MFRLNEHSLIRHQLYFAQSLSIFRLMYMCAEIWTVGFHLEKLQLLTSGFPWIIQFTQCEIILITTQRFWGLLGVQISGNGILESGGRNLGLKYLRILLHLPQEVPKDLTRQY
jgi:hypothetical protein